MAETLDITYQGLLSHLAEMGSALVAFSGGVDSSLLAFAAHEALGSSMRAATLSLASAQTAEKDHAQKFCEQHNIPLDVIAFDQLELEGFASNPKNRCYICKKALMERLIVHAHEVGMSQLVEGSHADDVGRFRPGMAALQELGVRSPLLELGIGKQTIRALLKWLGLPEYARKSESCLATRFSYGQTLTQKAFARVEEAECYLKSLGFSELRVRVHGSLARIELAPQELNQLIHDELRNNVSHKLHELGFSLVSLDMDGFRSGSMDEEL